ncbi:MAG: hypothetical protein HZB39_13690 [Planctomycetes bacterium]|nr:hypothetical protein [Planctomycetota bacterium]
MSLAHGFVALTRDEGGWETFWGGVNATNDGFARFESVPRGTFDVEVRVGLAATPLGRIVVTSDGADARFELRVR